MLGKPWFILTTIVAFFLCFHSYQLLALPPFADETAYMFWSNAVLSRGNPAEPLFDGTGPVFMLLSLPLIIISQNYLLAGRLVSLFANLINLLVIWKLSFFFTRSSKSALLSAFFWVCFPMVFVQGRLAILDPLTTMWIVLAIIMASRSSQNYWRKVFMLGCLLTAGFMTKPTLVIILPFLILLPFFAKTKNSPSLSQIILGISLASVTCFIILLPFQNAFLQLYSNYYKHTSEPVQSIISITVLNLRKQIAWLNDYLTLFGSLTLLGGVIILVRKSAVVRLLIVWIMLVIIINAVIGTSNIFPRHTYQLFPAIAMLFSYLIVKIKEQHAAVGYSLVTLLFGSFFLFTGRFIQSPPTAPLPQEDKYQLFEDWTSGYGLSELAKTLRTLGDKEKMHLIVDDKWTAHALRLFFQTQADMRIREDLYLQTAVTFPFSESGSATSYLLLNRRYEIPTSWPIKIVWRYEEMQRKPITLYQTLP